MRMAAKPTPAQRSWMSLRYGMFVHFGPNAFAGVSVGDGTFPAWRVRADSLDVRSWARLAAESGMKYAVLTAKHVDGFCLWHTGQTNYSVSSTPAGRDIVGEFAEACRAEGLQMGLYYALWDRHCPFYEEDELYAQFVMRQITELLTGYGPILELWFDGGWDKDHPTRDWPHDPSWHLTGERWRWKQIYYLAHELQPDCLVTQNSSSDRPGIPNYMPVDFRTSEHYDFVFADQLREAVTDTSFALEDGGEVFLPLEFCETLTPDWFWKAGSCYSHPSAAAIRGWYLTARNCGANLLLNVGPNSAGLIPDVHKRYLASVARDLGIGH